MYIYTNTHIHIYILGIHLVKAQNDFFYLDEERWEKQ